MDKAETIAVNKKGVMASISLDRPQKRNALNLKMIREITTAIRELNSDPEIRLIRITSTGDHFCSGADLSWMRSGLELSEDQLKGESLELAKLFRVLWESEAPTICTAKGTIPGGAIGLLAASDLVVAESTAILTFSEVRLGLVPATIAPYVLRKAGFSRTSEWMMTGRQITAVEAKEAGLIQRICKEGSLEQAFALLAEELLSGGAAALKGVKSLLRSLQDLHDPDQVDEYTSRLIAAFRISPEGQEGMKAFLERRKPGWNE